MLPIAPLMMEHRLIGRMTTVMEVRAGDLETDVPAGTSFADLPDGWACSVCGAGKDAFEHL